MKHLATMALIAATAPAVAQGARTVIDDTGAEVTLPADPQRIVSLHDTSLTVALLELGMEPVGSHGRTRADGTPYIRSSATATGTDFDNSGIAFVGNLPADEERVAAADPDLIVTTSWQTADVDRLRQIAPTYVFDIATADDFDVYARLAEITGRDDRLAALEARYEAQLDLIRSQVDTEDLRVAVIQGHEGELLVWNTYGTLGKVLRDAGFQFPEIVDAIEGNRVYMPCIYVLNKLGARTQRWLARCGAPRRLNVVVLLQTRSRLRSWSWSPRYHTTCPSRPTTCGIWMSCSSASGSTSA